MGADGLLWVRWGAGSKGVHKINAWGDKNGRTGPDLGPMVGEISPNIMFCQTTTKWTETAPDGCGWVSMGALGCMGYGGAQKQYMQRQKWSYRP